MKIEELKKIQVTNLIEMDGLFVGVFPDKKLHLKCTHAKKDVEYIFEVNYLGIALGNVAMIINNGLVEVEAL